MPSQPSFAKVFPFCSQCLSRISSGLTKSSNRDNNLKTSQEYSEQIRSVLWNESEQTKHHKKTKILPNFLMRFASEPLFSRAMPWKCLEYSLEVLMWTFGVVSPLWALIEHWNRWQWIIGHHLIKNRGDAFNKWPIASGAKGFFSSEKVCFHLLSCYLHSGQAIRTPTFRRFARIDSQKNIYVWSTWPDSRESRLLSNSHWDSRHSRPILAAIHFLEDRFATRAAFSKRESSHANRPTKVTCYKPSKPTFELPLVYFSWF